MHPSFRKATRYLAPEDILCGRESPLANFHPPAYLNQFFDDFTNYQTRAGHKVGTGFVYGGMFSSIAEGKPPRDIDMYICVPGFVAHLKEIQNMTKNMNSRMGRKEYMGIVEDTVSGFPVYLYEGLPSVDNNPVFGDYVMVAGPAYMTGGVHRVDLKIGSKEVALTEYLSHAQAPSLAIGMTLGGNATYAWHKDYADHLKRGIICMPEPFSQNMVDRAQRKNMTLVTPEQLRAEKESVQMMQSGPRQPQI